ncbi:MAG TPA: PIN domain-containing protein [Candidatus Diapherotrites archaeon]|uniref:PIN domain-containing protein n=1 Tax=Candidatus Iainarchaeum sp. TaxID=3101447 RepID=A0A7J4JEE4_9ARCH|nr:PIN domain-containing protein [Candidatus Diapherotrites archaeon]HIH16123.1 PIN domain-containing protein [Candidatus Diapherotrites archaeon]
MNGEFFVDTNVLAYVFDTTDPQKNEVSKKIVGEVMSGLAHGVVSNQVLAELFSILSSKSQFKMNKEEARATVNGFIVAKNWRKINYTASTVSKAMRRSAEHGTPLWDALIVETMVENGVYTLLTEDANGFKDCPVKVVNPFKAGAQTPASPA